MRIGVEDTVAEHHPRIALDQRLDELPGRHQSTGDLGVQRIDARPFHELQHEHVTTGEGGLHPRNTQARLVGKALAHSHALHGLAFKIHFFAHVQVELVEYDPKAEHMMVRKARVHRVHDGPRQPDIAHHDRFHVGTQHLHHDLAPLVARAVYLTERARSQRRRVELIHDAVRVGMPRLLQRGANLRPRHRWHSVGECTQGGQIRLRHQIGARREDLRQLHERRTEHGDFVHHAACPALVELGRTRKRAARTNPPAAVAQERHNERNQSPENGEQPRQITPRHETSRRG